MSGRQNIFREFAPAYFDMGISVIPTGGPDGKRPLENGFMQYAEHLAYPKTQDRWVEHRPDANIGIMAGPVSGLTVVDVDDPNLVDDAIAEFGDTPVKDQSPRGGAHFYYRHNGEKTLNKLDKRDIDVRGAGGNPLLIAPPSVHQKSGKPYVFTEGGIEILDQLPTVKDERSGDAPL